LFPVRLSAPRFIDFFPEGIMSACFTTTTAISYGNCGAVFHSTEEIARLIEAFESCALSRAEWTHAAHLTVALWYHLTAPADEVTDRVRDGIKRFNAAHGIVTTPTGGYHETMTLFWIAIVAKYLRELPGRDHSFVALANGLIERYGDKSLPFTYYTRERLFSPEARARWITPDLKTLNT
jgi:hypothetical protein